MTDDDALVTTRPHHLVAPNAQQPDLRAYRALETSTGGSAPPERRLLERLRLGRDPQLLLLPPADGGQHGGRVAHGLPQDLIVSAMFHQ